MKPLFDIRAEWPRAPQEGELDLAHLSLWSLDTALTQLADLTRNETRTYFKASGVALALWLSENWWRLRHEPIHDGRRPSPDWRLRHELSSISGGSLWPPLMIYGTGAQVMISPAIGANLMAGPVRYLELDMVHSIDGGAFESAVDRFLKTVAEHCAGSEDSEALKIVRDQLVAERADPDVAAYRRLEAQLGFDPDQAPDDVMDRLAALEQDVGEQAVEEAALSSPGSAAGETLEQAIDAAKSSAAEVDLAMAGDLDAEVFDAAAPWRMGEAAAHWARRALDISEGPVSDEALSRAFGRAWNDLKEVAPTARHLPYESRLTEMKATRLALSSQTPTDRRFEVSRMLADAMWAPQDKLGIVSKARTERQKFQRAFANSFLLPFNELPNLIDFDEPKDEEILLASQVYDVRPNVVRSALTVKGVLPRESLWDRLEIA